MLCNACFVRQCTILQFFYRNSLKPYTSRKMDAIDWWPVDCGARHPAQPRATSRKVAHIGSM